MTVRIGKMTFSDWISLPFQDGWSDTFIFRIDAQSCLPPFVFKKTLQRMISHTKQKRSSASIWIQVDSPGDWYIAEIKRSLKGLHLPFAVKRAGVDLDYLDFSAPATLLYSQSQPPPTVTEKPQSISPGELRCLQALGRMEKGDVDEIASLAGLSIEITKKLLAELEAKKMVVFKIGMKNVRDKTKPVQMDLFPLWHILPKGLSFALRSWSIPKGVDFSARVEENQRQIGDEHRHISRLWLAWLKAAWPRVEIWTGWSEVRIPGLSVIPDGLAWGRIQGYETLFWLEVGDKHKKRDKITEITTKRLDQAWKLCQRTGVRLVYAQLSTNWVHEAARWACVELPNEVAVVMGNMRKVGQLPMMEWGKVMGK